MLHAKKMILGLLQSMQEGTLLLTLPGGKLLRYGKGEDADAAHIDIHDERFFRRILWHGDIGFAESFMAGEWSSPDLTALLSWFLKNISAVPTLSGSGTKSYALNSMRFFNRIAHLGNKNSRAGSRRNISAHYDLSNDFFRLFLDESMTYSSAYFLSPDASLEKAQESKYESICRSLQLRAADQVLEIGSGWGGFAVYAAREYGCKVTSVTISRAQFDFATARVREEGLDKNVTVLLQDYRAVRGVYDKVVSIEMIEAVGARYLKTYFEKIHSVLKPDGILALQAIICPDVRFDLLRKRVDFIQKHIFPGSLLPSVAAINRAVNQTGDLFLFGLKDLGRSYVRTLSAWRERFHENLSAIRQLGFDEMFIRKWEYYFSYCEAAFAMRNINVVQMVYARPNTKSL